MEIASARLFRRGFIINSHGAFATGTVLISGVLLVLPPRGWPVALLPALDLLTPLVRRTRVMTNHRRTKRVL